MPEGKEQRWVIYVCEKCGEYGFVFGSQHSIPILECGTGGENPHEHVGPFRDVEVIPLADSQRRVEELEEKLRAEIECHEHDYSQLEEANRLLEAALNGPGKGGDVA